MAEMTAASSYNEPLDDVEKHRLLLEDNMNQLRKALQHWQTWDAEYEALKEEVEAIPDEQAHEHEHLREVHDTFEGELLVGKELDEIFGQQQRSKLSIINVLDRRIDYVSKNVQSLRAQVEAAEDKYDTAALLAQSNAADEDGPPITDIIEELDEDDNVVSYRLHNPGAALPQIKDALEKAGVDGLRGDTKKEEPQSRIVEEVDDSPAGDAPNVVAPATKQPESSTSAAPKKSVAFTPDTKVDDEPVPVMSRQAKRIEQIMKTAKEQEKQAAEPPVIPDDEDADDAELRRQMLKYGMGEVGAVVAELQLEDEDDDEGYHDDMWYDEEEMDDDDDDDEDKYGRSTGRIVTDSYKHRMLELEQQLGIKSRFTSEDAQQDADSDSDSNEEGIGRVVIGAGPSTASSKAPAALSKSIVKDKSLDKSDGKKGVRFAQELDIAPEKEAAPGSGIVEKPDIVEPLGDIVERSSAPKPAEAPAPRKQSRFKQARASETIPKGPFDVPENFIPVQPEPAPTPTGPAGTTLANTLVEKETVSGPMEPHEMDDSMLDSAVADEHQRMRRRFIQREGGFLKEDESPIQPLDETEGGRERISRFKAARLSRQ